MGVSFRDSSHLLPKLEGGSNFESWHLLVSARLQSAGVWKFIDETAVPPVQEVDEKDYQFQARLEAYNAQAAHTRMIILSSCIPRIQTTLANVTTAKACWEKLKLDYQPQGLIQKLNYWVQFVDCQLHREEAMEVFGARYRDAIDRCVTAGIAIDPVVQIMQFIHILDPHFDHWTANVREHMRRNPDDSPSLDRLIHEAIVEYRRCKERGTLEINVARCSYCRLRNHKEEICYYKHVHLRHPGWQPNIITLERIQQRRKGANDIQASTSTPPSVVDTLPTDIFDLAQYSEEPQSELAPVVSNDIWVADSGSNHHFCNNLQLFHDYVEDPLSINTGAGPIISPGYGNIDLQVQRTDKSYRPIRLHSARYMPTSSLNFISEHLLEQEGVYWHGRDSRFIIRSTHQEFASVTKRGGLKSFTVKIPSL